MSDKLFTRMAQEYIAQEGAELRRELDALSAEKPAQITPSLDRQVSARIGAMRRKRYIKTAGLIAACLMLAVLLPSVLRQQQSSPPPSGPPPADTSAPSPGITLPAGYEIIPLSFTMPEQFSVASVEQDIEKTVYYIEDSRFDDIVMTLEHSDSIEPYSSLTPVYIGSYTAYGSAEQGYRLLAFEKDGILYVLTCQYDINTLVELGETILQTV